MATRKVKALTRVMEVPEVLEWLRKRGSKRNIDGMARYGIEARKVYGVSMATMKTLARDLRPNHPLALELWESGWYEARLLAALIDDPALVTLRQMNSWVADFENWADCDTVCFHLFDKTPHAWNKVSQWAKSKNEFVKRAAFALMASLALHAKAAPNAQFRPFLGLIEKAATDDRNFVKKGVNWALRSIGRRGGELLPLATKLAAKLAKSPDAAPRWVGKDALREFAKVKSKAVRAQG